MNFLPFSRFSRLQSGICLSILCAAAYGFTTVVTKSALGQIPPLTLLTIQTAASAAFFWVAVVVQGVRVPWRWSSLRLGLNGLLEPGVAYIVGMFGLSLTTASNTAFISTTEPIATLILAWLILREPLSPLLMGLCLVACVGVGLVAAPDATAAGQGSLLGDILIALGVLFQSLYAITITQSIKQLPLVVVAALQQSVALVFFLIVTAGALASGLEVVEFTPNIWPSFGVAVASGAFGYGLAFLLYLSAARHIPPSRVSLYLTLTPVFGVIGAYLLLGEKLLLAQGLGGALILAAVVGISRVSSQADFFQGPPSPRQF